MSTVERSGVWLRLNREIYNLDHIQYVNVRKKEDTGKYRFMIHLVDGKEWFWSFDTEKDAEDFFDQVWTAMQDYVIEELE